MRHTAWCLAVAIGLAPAISRATPIEETWESVTVDGVRVGSVHTTVVEVGDRHNRRATADLSLSFRRHKAILSLRMEQGSEETADGKVVGVFMRQYHGGKTMLNLTGTLEDGRMHVLIDGGRIERRLPWKEEALGLYAQEHYFQKMKPKEGTQLTFHRFEPTLNTLVTVRVHVKEREEVALPGGKKLLLRVELTPDKIEVPGITVRPTPAVWWLDADFVPVRRQTELEGLGTLILTRVSKEQALAAASRPAPALDLGLKTLIPLNRSIPRPYDTRRAVYRITLRNDPDPGTALARDDHQEIRNLHGSTFELDVHPAQPDGERAGSVSGRSPPAAKELLASCHFINCADARIKELARRAVADETDPWRKALKIERWVKANMAPDNAAPFVPAGQVARSLRGDCRLYALLTAALCRAEGVPSRTAVGLIYIEKARRPQLGFHMWTEVLVDGRWLGVDSTLGRGGVSAAHLKIADHSWYDTQSLTPLLPVSRVLGKIGVTVLRVE